MFYSKNSNPVFNKNMSRNLAAVQSLKICYLCSKPFCKRKGRGKAVQVLSAPGRYVCAHCTDTLRRWSKQ